MKDKRAGYRHEYADGNLGRNDIPSRSQRALLSAEISREMLMFRLNDRKEE